MVNRTANPAPASPMNRQESHRIYLQVFSPRSASQHGSAHAAAAPILNCHGSHEIHPPNYPTTTPGAPYQFSSSSDMSQSSYSFSSLSTNQGGSSTLPHRPSSHTIKNRFTGYPSTVTTSAAVRLTDKARSKDVTALLRGKFGLPPISSKKKNSSSNYNPSESSLPNYYSAQSERSKMPTRLSQVQKDGKKRYSYSRAGSNSTNDELESSRDEEEEVDALVLIGTIEGSPKGYLRFEHEELLEEQKRLEIFRHYRSQQQQQEEGNILGQLKSIPRPSRVRETSEETVLRSNNQRPVRISPEKMAHLPVSESAATVQASGAQPGWASSVLLAPSASSEGTAMNLSESEANLPPSSNGVMTLSSGTIGLDLSSSRNNFARAGGAAGNRTTSWGSLRGIGAEGAKEMDFSSSRGKLTTLVSEISATPTAASARVHTAVPMPLSQPKPPSPCYEHDLEPIHIVRTVLPDEHPLHVRDEMMSILSKLRQEAEAEMGLKLGEESEGDSQRHVSKPTFRWYFQPCSPLGGMGSSAQSPKIQSIPAYIDIEGYCTEDESENDNDDNDGIDCNNSTAEDDRSKPFESVEMRQLIEEKQRIAMLRDLSDPSFLVSGYLMKQSSRDPNVWRRVYCVLSEDRMWTIGRMKPLQKSNNLDADDTMLSSLRVGRHKYIKLHRSFLLERGEGGDPSQQISTSRYSGYYLTPLGHRLPHTFRMLTSEGKCHTFRAFNSQSFRVWVTSLSEKIAQKHGDGMMDLANVISEEETLARCRRMDDIAVTPLGSSRSPISMDIVRFGIAVAAFKELCRHVNDAIRQCQYRNQSNVVNMQTRVGGGHTRARHPSSPTGSQRAKNMEHSGMVLSVWEDARMVASKSAQLLHALASLQHDTLGQEEDRNNEEKNLVLPKLVEEQKTVQMLLGKHWDQQNNMDDTLNGHSSLPPMHLFDPLLEKLQVSGI